MSEKLHILHEPEDDILVTMLVDFLGEVLPTCTVTCSYLEGHAADAATAVAEAAAVIGVLTPNALAAACVPFELGMARALGKPIFAVRDDNVVLSALGLPIPGSLIAVVTDRESLIEVFREVAALIDQPFAVEAPTEPQAELSASEEDSDAATGEAASTKSDEALDLAPSAETAAASETHAGPQQEPEAQPLSPLEPPRPVAPREATQPRWSSPPAPPSTGSSPPETAHVTSTTPATAPAASEQPSSGSTIPTCSEAFEAGSAFAEAMLGHNDEANLAAELDPEFGRFMAALGANWNTLKSIEDVDLWVEMADNVIAGLPPNQTHLRTWYGIGFELSTLLNLANVAGSGEDRAAIDELWTQSMEKLSAFSQQAQLGVATAAVLEGMLENLRDPSGSRDAESVLQLQGTLKEHAALTDQA